MLLHRQISAERDVDDTDRSPLRPALGPTGEWDDTDTWDLYEKAVAVRGHALHHYGRCQEWPVCRGETHD